MRYRKLKNFIQSLNIVIVPNGATGSIRQFRLSKILLYIIPIIILIPVVLSIYYVNLSNEQKVKHSQLNSTLVNTTSEYEHLQQEIESLKQQKSDMTLKLEQLEKLEVQMREYMTELPEEVGPKGGTHIPVTAATASADFIQKSDELITRYEETIDMLEETHNKIQHFPTILPTESNVITSPYGIRTDPFNRTSSFHSGIDFRGKIGSPVYATANGIIELSKVYGGYGKAIIIKHNDTYKTLYGHLSDIKVKKGQEVKKGELIGLTGNTGRSTGPHLHYEVLKHGEPVNPIIYINYFK